MQYCLPTDSPDFARTVRPLALAMSHLVWARHRPDRFDSYSCGACPEQLLPGMDESRVEAWRSGAWMHAM